MLMDFTTDQSQRSTLFYSIQLNSIFFILFYSVLPARKSFSIISKVLLAGPRVASCFVALRHLMASGTIPMDGSIGIRDMCRCAVELRSVKIIGTCHEFLSDIRIAIL